MTPRDAGPVAPPAPDRARTPETTSTTRGGRATARVGRFLVEPDRDPPDRVGLLRWRPPVRAAQRHPLAADVVLAVILAGISARRLQGNTAGSDGALWILHGALLAPLVARRRWPVAVFVTLSVVALVQWSLGYRLVADVALLVALYTLAAHRPRRVALVAAAVVEIGVVMATARWSLSGSWVHSLVALTAMTAAAVLLGTNLQSRRAHLATLTERAERLERERDQQARIAAAAERARIAREMHDVIAHSLAVMVALADGARAKLASEPERAAAAIDNVSDLGRQSLRETRRLLGVLRADDTPEPTAPQPGVAQLDDLVGRVRATGLDASLAVDGDPFAIPPGAGLTVYRIVQEALTNSLKHATGARRVHVQLRYRAPTLDVAVNDDGRAPAPTRVGGAGLAGMRERASVYRGTVVAGPDPSGGWHVRATLPVGLAPAGHDPSPVGLRGHQQSPAGSRGHQQSPAGSRGHQPSPGGSL